MDGTLRVEIHLHGGLLRYVPDAPRGILWRELPEGARVSDIVASFEFLKEGSVIVGVDGQSARLDDPVRDGARIDLVPPIAGGQHLELERTA